jgi:hypothetical protein
MSSGVKALIENVRRKSHLLFLRIQTKDFTNNEYHYGRALNEAEWTASRSGLYNPMRLNAFQGLYRQKSESKNQSLE